MILNLIKLDLEQSKPGLIKAPDWNGQAWYRFEGETDSKVSEYNGIKKHFATIPDNSFDFFQLRYFVNCSLKM